MEANLQAWYNPEAFDPPAFCRLPPQPSENSMAKPHRGLKKANHGARPANSKARKAKRKHIKT
jgi:hypothetical protein